MTTAGDPDCVFCRIVAREVESDVLYEDDELIAFRDLYPKAPVHGLVIPKRHVATLDDFEDGDSALLGRLMLVAKRIAADHGLEGYRVVMNVNEMGGQVIFHAHLHIMGGRRLTMMG